MRGGAQPAGEKSSGNDKAADASRPHGCAVVPAGLMPRGLFAALPATGKGETDATSLNARRKPDHPAHAPMAAHMAESGAKSKRLMLQCSIAGKMSLLYGRTKGSRERLRPNRLDQPGVTIGIHRDTRAHVLRTRTRA